MLGDSPAATSIFSCCVLILFLTGCSATRAPSPQLKQPEVTLGPILEVLKVETGSDKVRVVPDPNGQVHVFVASKKSDQVLHVTVRDNKVSEPKIVQTKVSPSRIDGAFDRKGKLHALIDTKHMILEDNTWQPSPLTPWTGTDVDVSGARFVPGATELIWAFEVQGRDVGSPLRMDIYGFGGYNAGIIWPWFSRGTRLVLTSEDHLDCWNVFHLSERFDSLPTALVSDRQGNIHVIYTKTLGGILTDIHTHSYLSINARELAPDPEKYPNLMHIKIKDRALQIQEISGSQIPGRRNLNSGITVDPESGVVLAGMRLLIKGDMYTDSIQAQSYSIWSHLVPAGKNTFHALYYGDSGNPFVCSLFPTLEWSAPLQIGASGGKSFFRTPSWEAMGLASIDNNKAFATWSMPHSIAGRWITWDTDNETKTSPKDYPMRPMHSPANTDAFDPALIKIDVTPHDKSIKHNAHVHITDSRKEKNYQRTTIGGISMSQIVVQPEIPEVVKTMVETKADQSLSSQVEKQPVAIECEIRVFEIATPATLLYWDVTSKIELLLQTRGQQQTVSAVAYERTYIWPSEEMLTRVVKDALRQIGEESERALKELLSLPPFPQTGG